jgi:hypothetical protein
MEMNAKNKWVTVLVIMLLAFSATAFGQATEDVVAIRAEFAKAIDNHALEAIASYFADDAVWVACVPTPLGNVILRCVYTAQNAGKTRFGGVLEYINGLPLFGQLYPDEEQTKFAGGQVGKVGRNTYEATFLEYRTKTIGPAHVEIVGIDFVAGDFEITGPDLIRSHGTGSYYIATQDADHDGFPDEGQTPVLCVPWQWTARRLTVTPGCVPTPTPRHPGSNGQTDG